jgi:hypothetical protein
MKFLQFALATALSTLLVFAAGIDGKWVSERKMTTPNGEERTVRITMELKAEGSQLTGKVTSPARGGEDRSVEIKEGKITGNSFSFITVMETQRGEIKSVYEGKLEGDTLVGTIKREGGQREMPPQPFEAKRAQ